jgi:hypothetical protein
VGCDAFFEANNIQESLIENDPLERRFMDCFTTHRRRQHLVYYSSLFAPR